MRLALLLLVATALPAAAAPICEEVDVRRGQLAELARANPASLDRALAQYAGEVGAPALAQGLKGTGEERVAAFILRLGQACGLWSLPQGYSSADREKLAEILARPEFAGVSDAREGWLERAFRWLRRWFLRLIETRGAERFAEGTRWLVLALAAVVAGWAVLRLLRVRVGWRRSGGVTTAPSEPLRLEDPQLHLARARSALAADPREAIREGLLGLLSALERRRFARPDRVKTNRELASELPRRGAPPGVQAEVRRMVEWYDGAFYSLQPVPAAEAATFLDEVASLERTLSGGTR